MIEETTMATDGDGAAPSAGWARELAVAKSAIGEAAAAVMQFYDLANAGVYEKEDKTPLTDADLASDRILCERITAAFPADALLTEESADDSARLANRRVWIADPIDGTQQFISRTGEFDIFLALVLDGRPVVGVAAHPPSGQVLWATEGAGAWMELHGDVGPLRFAPYADGEPVRVATSHYHGAPATLPLLTEATERAGFEVPRSLPMGFQARAFADPATGNPRYEIFVGPGREIDGPNFSGGEWDNAAADLIVREAGGAFTDIRGRRFTYNKPDSRNFGGIFAASNPVVHERLLAIFSDILPQPK